VYTGCFALRYHTAPPASVRCCTEPQHNASIVNEPYDLHHCGHSTLVRQHNCCWPTLNTVANYVWYVVDSTAWETVTNCPVLDDNVRVWYKYSRWPQAHFSPPRHDRRVAGVKHNLRSAVDNVDCAWSIKHRFV